MSFSCVIMPGAAATVLPASPRDSSQRQQVTPCGPGLMVMARSPCQDSPSLRFSSPIMALPCTMKMKRGSGGNWNSTVSALESTSS